jgi:hypothetical protein
LIATISRLTKPPARAAIEPMLWHRKLIISPGEGLENGQPWWKRVGLWFGIVVALFVAIYAVFW